MKKKMRKFGEGGYSTVDPENPVPSIDNDTRSRAMKYVEGASEESRDIGAPVTRSAAKSTSKVSQTVAPPTKPAVDMDAEKARMEKLTKSQALESVHPEDYVTPGGLLKGMFKKVASMGAKRAEKEIARTVTNKAGKEIPIKQAEMNAKPSPKAGEFTNKSGKKVPVRRGNEGIADDGGSGMFKRGGSVSSASRRADGCAMKGKTRGKYL